MLISALCDYYDVLQRLGKVLPEGYSTVDVQYLIALREDGGLASIIDWQETKPQIQKGKTKEIKRPRSTILPKRTEKPGIDGNIIEHRPLYIFGLNYVTPKNGTPYLTPEDRTNKAKKSREDFAEKNLEFIEGMDTPVVNAYRNFILNWQPKLETENPLLLALGKDIATGRFAFCLAGSPDVLLHEAPEIRERWEKRCTEESGEGDSVTAQCSVTGRVEPIARIHGKIKGLPGGRATGNTLVSFKNPADSSYGMEQSYNSCISESAMKKYTEALNYLISDRRHRSTIDETTYIYWAADGNEACEDIMSALVFGDTMDREKTDQWLKSVFGKIKSGKAAKDIAAGIDDVDPNVNFYIVGIKPNSARLSVKCIYRRSFGGILQNVIRHCEDMQIGSLERQVSLNRIGKELISPKSKNEEVSPALTAKLLEAVINGTAYPDGLLAALVRRVKTDSDEENNNFIKMNDVRMGMIKACINRADRLRGKEEEIKMSLNPENCEPAYVCGRLFFALEDIQRRALGDKLNRTIKDAYFASAATRPAVVFPRLLSLSQHHLAKLEDNEKFFRDRDVTKLIDMLGDEFPPVLSLREQGIFMLGYYQQRNQRFEKKTNAAEADE